ncbi:17-beta-hydroxysteroid dehydrogenase type 2 isoform X1 [Takifugu rubripes]|uniref:17-beta-hydroxysteroid dehydrogenase type 2 isoform X1 n=1 Tax=Takifugu rubripes TaxID=31033 RepID=UPI001145BD75|nr:estradiol 17-beta-dehydrogenase 2-like isoform X1 [Takifugu rubripes]
MDGRMAFRGAAWALFAATLLWKLKRRSSRGFCAAAFVASLHFLLPPIVHEVLLLVCSSVLVGVAHRGCELLPVENRAVLVTGCDSGFGHELARRLSQVGVLVFAGVLDAHGAGAQRLRAGTSEKLQVLQLDVTDDRQIEAAHRYICTQVNDTGEPALGGGAASGCPGLGVSRSDRPVAAGLWGLVNNAGILQCPVDAEIQPMKTLLDYLDVNFLGAVKMSQVFLPLLRRSRGRIINMSSLAGAVPVPLFAAYGASKAALAIYSEVMRLELSAWGVRVSLVQPSGFRTNIFGASDDISRHGDQLLATVSSEVREDYGHAYISSLPGVLIRMSQQSAADLSPVVDAMYHALLSRRPAPLYTPGQMAWLLPFLRRCCPSAVFDSITMKLLNLADHQPAGIQS